jgi:cell division protease FtsH
MKNFLRQFGIVIIVLFILAGVWSYFYQDQQKSEVVSLQSLITAIQDESIEKINVDGTTLTITLKTGEEQRVIKEPRDSFGDIISNFEIPQEKIKAIEITVEDETPSLIASILPFLLPFLIIGFFIFFMMRQVQGANSKAMMFGQSTARESNTQDKNKITFKDVAGVKEAKEELLEVVEFLKSPKKFQSLGAKIPKGVLLLGPPGTGKTLLARAVAGEANVPFFHISGSEFVEMFVGVGASRVRDLFKKAKKSSPCIIFIDEIDAVGRQRGAGLGGSHDEREQTLNQILVEMDGFDAHTNVIVVAATNRPDVLDPALLRPGRFDRRVMIDRPDLLDREGILKVHAKSKPLSPDISIKTIAKRTPGFTGADLQNLLNEAAILAARKDKKIIDMEDILESIDKVLLGPARKSRIFSEKEKEIIAYHEAGHAVVGHMLPNSDPVEKVSIVARGHAGGYTLKLPEEDKHLHSLKEFVDDLAMMLGGYASEQIYFNDITTGPGSDLRNATQLAKQIVTEYGMSKKLGPRTFGEKEEMVFLGRDFNERQDYSDLTADQIDKEIKSMVDQALKTAIKIIKTNDSKVKLLVKNLLEKETVEKDEFVKLMS